MLTAYVHDHCNLAAEPTHSGHLVGGGSGMDWILTGPTNNGIL